MEANNTVILFLKFIVVNLVFAPVFSARILGIIPTPSYSHQVVFQPIWRELSKRGHEVVVITTNPINDPTLTNLTEIDISSSYNIWNEVNLVNMSQKTLLGMINKRVDMSLVLHDHQLSQPQVRALIDSNTEHFDLVMTESVFPIMNAFAWKFKAPLIGMLSIDALNFHLKRMGSPTHPILYPDSVLPFTNKLSFSERLNSAVFYPVFLSIYGFYIKPLIEQLTVKHFGTDCPSAQEMDNNISLLFINSEPIFHNVRPLVPTIIQIGGGTHLKDPKPLPKDLQVLLDNATEGFIYFSLGSNVKSKDLSKESWNIILEAFSEIPYTVLWKFELDNLPNKPKNVHISKWFPQQDIFRHRNIKLFITQGGLQSLEEAVYNYIPILGMPFTGDQPHNIKNMVHKGIALLEDYKTLNKITFKNKILELVQNPKYRIKVKELAELARDQPMTGLERAIWWTEYVIRHKGARHLRSPALDLPWYQFYLLDVIGFVVASLIGTIFLIYFIIKLVIKVVRALFIKRKVKQQ